MKHRMSTIIKALILSVMLCLLAFDMMPTAHAAELPDYTLVLSLDGKAYKNELGGEELALNTGDLAGLRFEGGQWVMENFNFTTTSNRALHIKADDINVRHDIAIKVKGTNRIATADNTSTDETDGKVLAVYIELYGTTTLEGSGTLNIHAGSSKVGICAINCYFDSSSIYRMESLTVSEGTTLNVTTGDLVVETELAYLYGINLNLINYGTATCRTGSITARYGLMICCDNVTNYGTFIVETGDCNGNVNGNQGYIRAVDYMFNHGTASITTGTAVSYAEGVVYKLENSGNMTIKLGLSKNGAGYASRGNLINTGGLLTIDTRVEPPYAGGYAIYCNEYYSMDLTGGEIRVWTNPRDPDHYTNTNNPPVLLRNAPKHLQAWGCVDPDGTELEPAVYNSERGIFLVNGEVAHRLVLKPLPAIDSVTVTPERTIGSPGDTLLFTAEVNTYGDLSGEVYWTVQGASSSKTQISSAGQLVIGEDETAEELLVLAVSKEDSSQYDSAPVVIIPTGPAPNRDYTLYINQGKVYKKDAEGNLKELTPGTGDLVGLTFEGEGDSFFHWKMDNFTFSTSAPIAMEIGHKYDQWKDILWTIEGENHIAAGDNSIVDPDASTEAKRSVGMLINSNEDSAVKITFRGSGTLNIYSGKSADGQAYGILSPFFNTGLSVQLTNKGRLNAYAQKAPRANVAIELYWGSIVNEGTLIAKTFGGNGYSIGTTVKNHGVIKAYGTDGISTLNSHPGSETFAVGAGVRSEGVGYGRISGGRNYLTGSHNALMELHAFAETPGVFLPDGYILKGSRTVFDPHPDQEVSVSKNGSSCMLRTDTRNVMTLWGYEAGAAETDAITLSGQQSSVEVRNALLVRASVSPANVSYPFVLWESSDPSAVQVFPLLTDPGSAYVVGLKEGGTATITATAPDGSGETASFDVKVTGRVIRSISLEGVPAPVVGQLPAATAQLYPNDVTFGRVDQFAEQDLLWSYIPLGGTSLIYMEDGECFTDQVPGTGQKPYYFIEFLVKADEDATFADDLTAFVNGQAARQVLPLDGEYEGYALVLAEIGFASGSGAPVKYSPDSNGEVGGKLIVDIDAMGDEVIEAFFEGTLSIQWYRLGTSYEAIPGANTETYTVTAEDAGKKVRAEVTYNGKTSFGEYFEIPYHVGMLVGQISGLDAGDEVEVFLYSLTGGTTHTLTLTKSYSALNYFLEVPPGRYGIRVTANSYRVYTARNILVVGGDISRHDVKLTSAPLVGIADSSGIRVRVSMDLMQDAVLIIAQYEGEKMVDVQLFTISNDNTYYCTELTHKTGCTYKAFLVKSTTYAPLCAADDF